MDTPRTPPHGMEHAPEQARERIDSAADTTLERGFVASLRWLVAEGDTRGVRRIAVELRALREALTTLDETRAARDEHARRAQELDRELQAAMTVLGPGTAVHGNGTLVQRLARLRERLAEDVASRRQLTLERDAWRAMCTLLTRTRAHVHELLDDNEKERDNLAASLDVMRERVVELTALHDDARREASAVRGEMATLRGQLAHWGDTVERALSELGDQAKRMRP